VKSSFFADLESPKVFAPGPLLFALFGVLMWVFGLVVGILI
jgi:hypothetical protein